MHFGPDAKRATHVFSSPRSAEYSPCDRVAEQPEAAAFQGAAGSEQVKRALDNAVGALPYAT